ncbi:MAG: hypothetical protein JWO98_4103, partial [Frankiales bacterium]|nr:hypothetical protein [Frankiales bacterium]
APPGGPPPPPGTPPAAPADKANPPTETSAPAHWRALVTEHYRRLAAERQED